MAKLPDVVTQGLVGGRRGRGGAPARPRSLEGLPVQAPRSNRALPGAQRAAAPIQRAANIQAASARQAGAGLTPWIQTAQILGRKEQQAEEARQAAQDRLALAMAEARFIAANVEEQAKFQGDPDYGTYGERYSERMSAAQERILEGLPEHLKPYLQTKMVVGLARGQVAVQKLARGQEKDSKRAELTELGQNSMQTALQPGDPVLSTAMMQSYGAALQAAADSGYITRQEQQKMGREWVEQYAGTRIAEWFREQPDVYAAAQQFRDGEVDDPAIQNMLNFLPEESRASIFKSVLEEESKLATLRNRAEQDKEDAAKAVDLELQKGFYFDMTDEERYDAFETLKNSPHISVKVLQDMEKSLHEGPVREDNDFNVTAAGLDINSGEIRSPEELIEAVVDFGWEITPKTFGKLADDIVRMQDKRFSAAMSFGRGALQVPQGGMLFGSVFEARVNKVAAFQADMHTFKFDNPDGEFMDYARKWVAQDEKAPSSSGADVALPIMTQSYRDALASGDPEQISNARSVLITIMVDARMVTAQDAARAGFDPLSIIDEPAGAPAP